MSQAESPVASYIALRTKNLHFFQHNYPGIYDFFSTYEMKRSKLDILPETNEVDLIENNQHVYGGAAKEYSPNEVKQFLTVFDYGKKIRSIAPLYGGTYKNPRFFAKRIDAIYQKSPLKKEAFSGYIIPQFLPLVVFMGCGLGLHIKNLCEQREVHHACVVETNMDRFAASLYTVDWDALVSPYLSSEDKSFNFILTPGEVDEQQVRSVVWNHLIDCCPIFPVMALFYNHLGVPAFDRVIDAINTDLYVHLFSFGNYDDEINQLNNAIHNFKLGAKRLPLPKVGGFDFPVCIVGSGPSLDDRIEWLHRFKDKALVISCGTALRALHRHGIKPDIQVELESDYKTFDTQNLMEDKAYMRSIKLIGAAQLNPLLLSLFDEKRLFFKAEGVLQGLFAEKGEAIKEAAPTCTNAALAIAFHFGFSQLFLFGLDYGFPDKKSHHAKGAIYYKEDGPDGLRQATSYADSDLIEVEAADGATILTTNFLYISKRRTENIIFGAQHPQIYNCSNGSRLANTLWLTGEQFDELDKAGHTSSKQEVINYLFNPEASSVSDDTIEVQGSVLERLLHELVEQITQMLSGPVKSPDDITKVCFRINHWLQSELKQKSESFYYLIRGSIWHFLHAGFSHASAIEDGDDRAQYASDWKAGFISFLTDIESHFGEIIHKSYNLDEDLLVHRSITLPESGSLAASVPSFKDIDWEFSGLIVDEDGRYSAYTG